MDNFVLTADILKKAKTYLPIAEKMAFASEYAPRCFDRLQITNGEEQMPPMYMENTGLKSRYLMYALVIKYLRIDCVETESDALLTEAEYDRFAHILQQLDRFKRDKDVQNIAYDLVADYYDLDKRFNSQVRGLLEVQNDTVMRQQMISTEMVKQFPAMMEELKALVEKRGG